VTSNFNRALSANESQGIRRRGPQKPRIQKERKPVRVIEG
jgi:hypothetical protein